MNKPAILIFTSLILIVSWLHAETDERSIQYRTWIMGVPQHLFENGIRIEFDRALEDNSRWIVIAPSVYFRDKPGNYFSPRRYMDSMFGLGLEVFYRYYLSYHPDKGNYYVAAGGGFRWIDYQYRGFMWRESMEDDLTYYRYHNAPWTSSVTNYKASITAGYFALLRDNMAIDFFIGGGFVLTESKDRINAGVIYSESGPYRGYSGFEVVAGIRLGVGW